MDPDQDELRQLEELLLQGLAELQQLNESLQDKPVPKALFFDPDKLELAMRANFVECELFPCKNCG